MKIEKVSTDTVTLTVPTDEILYLYNSICITLEKLGPSLFEGHTGKTSESAVIVRDQFADLIDKIKAL